MNQLVQGVGRFIREDEGVTMVEYGLLAALIAVVCVLAIQTLGQNLNTVFTNIGTCLSGGACNGLGAGGGGGGAGG